MSHRQRAVAVANRARHDRREEVCKSGRHRQAGQRARQRRQGDEAAGDEERQQAGSRPQAARRDERVEYEQQRGRLVIAAGPERARDLVADRRDADEAEHQRRAQPAFEPVERVRLKRLREDRGPHEQEARERPGGVWKCALGGQIRLLHDLGVDLGEDPRVGQPDGEHARPRRDAEDLQQQQRPEQLVDRPQAGGANPHRAVVEGERHGEAEARAEGDACDGKSDGEHDLAHRDRRDVRPDEAACDLAEIGPRVESADAQVGEGGCREREAEERPDERAVAEAPGHRGGS